MKTKNLFLATALMASFAACTNEEIVSEQQNVAAGRPTVDNVKLTFGENVDSRLAYVNKSWEWEATDKIGALLMDVPGAGWGNPKAEWDDKYTLAEFIHTSYPFSYSVEDKTWGTPGKLLEGNYFFAYPWESYEGQRKVSHSLINQKQTGITADVRAKSYANNQFFIGYDRIIAGTQDAEALNNVSMTSILGAIELRIVNTGTQTYNINKVVLSGGKLASKLTFNPADVDPTEAIEKFNTANYLDYVNEGIYCADDLEDYDKDEALRAVVKAVPDAENDFFAQLNIDGENTLLPNAKNTAYVLLMANSFEVVEGTDHLYLSIYTDEGLVNGIDLTKVAKAAYEYGYITDAKIKKIHPLEKNVITIQLDDNVIKTPEDMVVYNTQDLEQLIEWNASVTGLRDVVVTLAKDATLTKKAYDAFVGKKNMTLTVNYPATRAAAELPVLTLAEGLPVNIFENEDLDINTNVEALCDLELTEECNTLLPAAIKVAEGAELTINDAFADNCDITSYGTLTIGANAHIKKGTFNNYGEMTVAKEAIMTKDSKVNNYGELVVNGYIKEITENGSENFTEEENEKAEITVGVNGSVSVTTNYGVIETEGALEVSTNAADAVIKYEGGDIDITTNNGKSRAEISGTIDEADIEDYMSEINTWVVTANVTFDDDENALSFATMEVKGGAKVVVEEESSVTITKMVVEGATTIEGALTVTTLDIEEGAKLTVDEDAVITATTINNLGVVKNNGTVKATTLNTEEGDWRGNDAEGYATSETTLAEKEAAYVAALSKYVECWIVWGGSADYNIAAAGYNLNRAEVAATASTAKIESAKNVFIKFYNAFANYNTYKAERTALTTAFNAYKTEAAKIKKADGTAKYNTTEWNAYDKYTDAVTRIKNLYDGTIAVDEDHDPVNTFATLKKNLTWAAPATMAAAYERIYVKTQVGQGADKVETSAEDNAKKAFQLAVLAGTIKNISADLTNYEKAMIMTFGGNYAPAGSQVLKTDNIYMIFNSTNGIGMKSDWEAIVGSKCQTKFETPELLDNAGWTLKVVQNWVEKIAGYNGTDPDAVIANAKVVEQNYAIYQESKTWKYADTIIEAIVADYNGWVTYSTVAGI